MTELFMKWQTWSLVFSAIVLLLLFGRLDLLAVVVPLSAVVGFGSWLVRRGGASHER
jgi:hypothetical protein